LLANSKDISFPGYPYGLIIADRFARVSNNEKAYLRTLFFSKAGGKTEMLVNETASINSHNILDSIN
jgi:hypothetical protein